MKLKAFVFASLGFAALATDGHASAFGTPDVYQVTFKRIEFGSGGSFATFASGSFTWDLACGGATNCDVGTIPPASQLPAGTYTQMRVTFSRVFTLKGSVAVGNGNDDGDGNGATLPAGSLGANPSCNTVNGGATGQGPVNGVNNLTRGAAGAAGAGTSESVPVPNNAAITAALTAAGISEIGSIASGDLQLVTAIPAFTIAEGDPKPPNLSIRFDVTSTLKAAADGVGGCYVWAQRPTVNIINR